MTNEEIQEQCESLSNEELLLVVNNKQLYTAQIVRVVYHEIRKCGLSKQEIKTIEKEQARQSKIITGNIHEDILFWEKIALFIICFPRLHFLVFRDYRKAGYVLKVRQALYYNLFGLAFALLCIIFSKHFPSVLVGVIIWISTFIPTYLFNEYYFKGRIIKYLTARTAGAEGK